MIATPTKAMTTLEKLASRLALVCASAALVLAPFARAQDGGGEDEAKKTEVDTKDDKYLAVVGADIYTGTGEVLRGATMLVRNGQIRRLGHDIYIPEQAKVVHAHGYRIYPGMVALSASSRIIEGSLSAEPNDTDGAADATGDPLDNPDWIGALGDEFDPFQEEGGAATRTGVHDSYDPFGQFLVLTLAAGITTIEQGDTPIRLRRDELDDVVLAEGVLVGFNWGSPDARRGTTEDFTKAAAYLREYRAWEAKGDKSVKEPSRRGINSGAVKVLRGDARAKFSADSANDLLGIARLAQRFGFRPVINGCREGWVVADELGRAGVTAIVQPRERRAKDELMVAPAGSSIENAAILHRCGVQVAVKPMNGNVDLSGIAGRDILALAIDAGFAVRGGLSDAAALQAVTIVPARILGVDHRIGTLEVGKDADFVITDGDLLHYETHVQLAFVLGELVYDKNEELYYAHIRPRPKIRITDGPDAGEEDASKPAEGAEAPPAEEKPKGDGPADTPPDETPPDDTPPDEQPPEDGR